MGRALSSSPACISRLRAASTLASRVAAGAARAVLKYASSCAQQEEGMLALPPALETHAVGGKTLCTPMPSAPVGLPPE